MKENIEKRVIGLFLLMLVILVGVAWAAVTTIKNSINKTAWVNHTHAVILEANSIAGYLHAGDAAMSAYLLTGDRRDQANYRTAYNAMINEIVVAEALTRRDASEKGQNNEFVQLEKLLGQHITFTRALVQARETGGVEGARQAAAAHPEGESTTDIDRLVAGLNKTENELLSQRDQEAYTQANNTRYVIYSGVVLNFALLLFVSLLIRDDLKARRVAATALEDANAQLEAKVQDRTAELVKSNLSLKKENLERRWSYQALDHQLRYNQLIVNSINEMVFVVSKVLNVSRVNPAVTHVTGWGAEDLISQSVERVLQLPGDGPANPMIAALNEGRELQDRPASILSKAGVIIAVRFNLVPLRDDNKVVGGVLTVRPTSGAPPNPG